MPFTPLHMGPGILLKSILQGSFSLLIFGWSQIVMDLQPLIAMITNEGKLHGFSHTFIGAILIAIVSALSGKYLSEFGLKLIVTSKDAKPIKISWFVAISSSFIGTFSHVILDAIKHRDIFPYFPFTEYNNFLGIISVSNLYKFCLYCGLIGVAIYYFVLFKFKKN